MARAIDADDLKRAVESFAGMLSPAGGFLVRQDAVLRAIELAPTIEAEPVKHGKRALPENVEIAITCICSECKNEFPIWAKKDYKYCPNCGARMRGEKE